MAKLVCKLNNLPIKNVLYQGKIHAPCTATSYDVAKVINKRGEKLDIITFRNKNLKNVISDVVRRYIIKKNANGTTVEERNYKNLKNVLLDNPLNPIKGEFLKVYGRKISTVTKYEGEFWNKSEETQTVTKRDGLSNVVHIKRVFARMFGRSEVEEETQSLYEYKKNSQPKGYTIKHLIKSKFGFSNDIIKPVFEFSGINEILVNFFKNDPYFFLHLYSFKQFKKFAPTCAKHPVHDLIFEPVIKWYSRDSGKGFWDGNVNLNRKKLTERLSVINISAHEKEHCFEEEQVIFNTLENNEDIYTLPMDVKRIKTYVEYIKLGGSYKIYSKGDAEKYWHNMQCYITPEEDMQLYENQIMERKARIAGHLAEKQYKESSNRLKGEFPYAPDYLIGVSIPEILLRMYNKDRS